MKLGDVVTLADTAPIGKGFKVRVLNVNNDLNFFCTYPVNGVTESGVGFGLWFDYNDLVEKGK